MSLSSVLGIRPDPQPEDVFAWRSNVTRLLDRTLAARIRTTDATPTTLATLYPRPNRTYFARVKVLGRRTGGNAGSADDAGAYIIYSAWTTKSGTTTLLGATHTPSFSIEDQAAWQAAVVISDNHPIVQVTGAANNNITWIATVEQFQAGI